MTETVEYKTWANMKTRCYNPKTIGWELYGGRGISVCDRWLNSFPAFFEDMGRKPSPTHSIDRIDPNGNYEPNNCRWATPKQQTENRRPRKRAIKMSDTTEIARRPEFSAGGQVAALVPRSLEEAFRVATAIAASGLAPQGMKSAEQILVAIMAGAELGLAPFQSLQSFAVINGRPTLWGDGMLAVARAQGIRVTEWTEGEGDAVTAFAEVTRPDTGEMIKRAFTVADAKKAGLWAKAGPWTQYPKRMLQMRARAWALRDGCADMLRGFQVREEVEDYAPVNVTPKANTALGARLAARTSQPTEGFSTVNGEVFDATTGEQIEETPPAPQESPPEPVEEASFTDIAEEPEQATEEPLSAFDAAYLKAWGEAIIDGIGAYRTADEVKAMWDDPETVARFTQLKIDNVNLARDVHSAVLGKRKALSAK